MGLEERATVAAQLMWNRGLIGAGQIDAAAEAVAIYLRDQEQAERERCAKLAEERGQQIHMHDPKLESWSSRGAVTMAEGIAKKIRESA